MDRADKETEKNAGHLERAKRMDAPVLNEIWREAFGDSESYVNQFFAYHYHAFLWKVGKIITTMVFVIPAKLKTAGGRKDACYLYAIATKKEYRGRRFLERMLPEIKRELGEEQILFLVPEPYVIPYYERLGLVRQQGLAGFFLDLTEEEPALNAAELQSAAFREEEEEMVLEELSDAARYRRIRERRFAGREHFVWGVNEIAWALENIHLVKGRAFVVKWKKKNHLLAGFWKKTEGTGERVFRIVETTLSLEDWHKAGKRIMEALHVTRVEQEPLIYMIEGAYADRPYYLSLALNE